MKEATNSGLSFKYVYSLCYKLFQNTACAISEISNYQNVDNNNNNKIFLEIDLLLKII